MSAGKIYCRNTDMLETGAIFRRYYAGVCTHLKKQVTGAGPGNVYASVEKIYIRANETS